MQPPMKQDVDSDLVSPFHAAPAQVLGICPRSSAWFPLWLVLVSGPAWSTGAVDPDTNAQNIKDNAVGGTLLDKVLGYVSVSVKHGYLGACTSPLLKSWPLLRR